MNAVVICTRNIWYSESASPIGGHGHIKNFRKTNIMNENITWVACYIGQVLIFAILDVPLYAAGY